MLDLYIESDGKRLRCGYTTGSCAAAAAKAATFMLFNDEILESINIKTPKGISLNIDIDSIKKEENSVTVSVIKDGGDDIDITNGIKIYAKVENYNEDFCITGGEGIGIVTKDGLFVKKGEYAINDIPRKMIKEEVYSVKPKNKGVRVTIFSPMGKEIAVKTFNPRLGIENGISILGTTGIVKPMSEEALKDSIKIEINQKAINKKRLVLAIGNIGEKCALENGFNKDEIVIVSNFIGFSLECCSLAKVKDIVLVGHIGKISKVAYGCFNTHSRVADVRLEVIALELALLGHKKELIEDVLKEKTSEGAVKLLGDGYESLYKNIGEKINNRMTIYSYGEIKCNTIMYCGFSDYKILYNSLEDK
ncbi:cobalt-precorrin-5B (C(1))-methyltransferase CbiD [Clostridium carnis]